MRLKLYLLGIACAALGASRIPHMAGVIEMLNPMLIYVGGSLVTFSLWGME